MLHQAAHTTCEIYPSYLPRAMQKSLPLNKNIEEYFGGKCQEYGPLEEAMRRQKERQDSVEDQERRWERGLKCQP